LSYIHQPYFIVTAQSREVLKQAQEVLNGLAGVLCHGLLFDVKEVDFAHGMQRFAGYRRDDIAIRDQDRTSFLYDLLHADTDKFTGYLSVDVEFEASDEVSLTSRIVSVPTHWHDPDATEIRLVTSSEIPLDGEQRNKKCQVVYLIWDEEGCVNRLKSLVGSVAIVAKAKFFSLPKISQAG
jgi:hypothetical protein